MVEIAPDLRIIAADVAGMRTIKVLEGDVEGSMMALVIHLRLGELGLDHTSLDRDSALLLLEKVHRQRICVVGLH